MHLLFRKRRTLAQRANVNEESIGGVLSKLVMYPYVTYLRQSHFHIKMCCSLGYIELVVGENQSKVWPHST